MGTHYRGTPAEVRALDAFIKLMRAAHSVSARLERGLQAMHLTQSQFGVLEALFHLGPMCQRELGTKLFSSGGNITTVVDNLEKRQLVKRVRGEADRRYVTVHLVPAGRRLMARHFPGHVKAIVGEFEPLGAPEQEELGRLCKKLGLGRQEMA